MENEKEILVFKAIRKERRVFKWFMVIGVVWGFLFLIAGAIIEKVPENLALFFSVLASGLYTLGLYKIRFLWRFMRKKPILFATLFGILNAAVIETIFLVLRESDRSRGCGSSPKSSD